MADFNADPQSEECQRDSGVDLVCYHESLLRTLWLCTVYVRHSILVAAPWFWCRPRRGDAFEQFAQIIRANVLVFNHVA
jgi:hypothetical protein